jgi:hypothetical protein
MEIVIFSSSESRCATSAIVPSSRVIKELTVCTILSEGWVRDCSFSSCSLKYMKALVDTNTRDVTHVLQLSHVTAYATSLTMTPTYATFHFPLHVFCNTTATETIMVFLPELLDGYDEEAFYSSRKEHRLIRSLVSPSLLFEICKLVETVPLVILVFSPSTYCFIVNLLKPSGFFTYHQVYYSKILALSVL